MRASTHYLFGRYSGKTWQLVALIAGVILLLAGVATARFGLFRGRPTLRADEPHIVPPPQAEGSPTPAILPAEEDAAPLPAQSPVASEIPPHPGKLSANHAIQLADQQPTLAARQREAPVAETAWDDGNAPLAADGSVPSGQAGNLSGNVVSPSTSWVIPPVQDSASLQMAESGSPAAGNQDTLAPNIPEVGEKNGSQEDAGKPAADAESGTEIGSPEPPQAPTPADPRGLRALPDTAANSSQLGSPVPSAAGIGPTASSPFDALPPPGTTPGPAIVQPPATRLTVDPPGSIPASASGNASPLVTTGGSASGAEGDARPGDPSLEGPQTPQITVHKLLPEEVQVGKPALFRIVVRNSGAITVPKLEVHDPIPWGVRVLRTNPSATQGTQGTLVWTLGPLKPGDESVLEAEVMPLQEGELGSVATVLIHTQASAKTRCTRPQLTVKTQVSPQAMIGDEILVTMTVSNTGSGVATNVILEEHVPPELQHPAGNELENMLGDLKPGESRQVQLKLQAVRAGNATNRLIARADGNLRVEDQVTIQVLAPQIEIAVEGPAKRFLDREATYQISLTNRGTAPAKNVRLTASLAAGLQFVRTNNAGSYDPTTHSVQWLLAELPIGRTGSVELVVNPIAAGEQDLVCSVQDDLGPGVEKRLTVFVEGISALHFQVADTKDPVAVGMETIYEIRVVNQGTKEATNVQVMAILPEGIRPLAGEGPVPNTVNGNEVLFGKLNRLAAKGEAVFRIRGQAIAPGDQRIRVQILSDDIRLPVTKEESTQVYSDNE